MLAGRSFVAKRLVRTVKPQFRFLSSYPNHEVVLMPALSPTMETGIIGKWLCGPGDKIGPGDAIAEIETDKASMAFEAQDDFFIAKLLVEDGTEVTVGDPILVSVEDADDIGSFADFKVAVTATVPTPVVETTPEVVSMPTSVAPTDVVSAASPAAAAATASVGSTSAVTTSPVPPAVNPTAVSTPQDLPTASPVAARSFRWGQAVVKSALSKKLAANQKAYIGKYGRSAHKIL